MRLGNGTIANRVYLLFLALVVLVCAALAFVAIPSLTGGEDLPSGYSLMLWPVFTLFVAGIVPLSLLTFRGSLVRRFPEFAGMRFMRLAMLGYLIVVFALAPVPVWYLGRLFHVPFNPWLRLTYHLLLAALPVLLFRYVVISLTWGFLRFMVPEGGEDDFLGSRTDQFFRPEYYDEDLKWLYGLASVDVLVAHTDLPSARLAVLAPMALFGGSLVLAGTLVAVAPRLTPYGDIELPDRAMAPHEFVEPDEPAPNDETREREVATLVERAATAGFEEAGTSLDELDPDFGPYRWDRFLVSQSLVIVNTSLENTREGRSTAGRIAYVIRGRLVDNHWGVDTLQVIAADGTVLKAVDFPTQPR